MNAGVTTEQKCPVCGAPIPGSIRGGQCVSCSIRLALQAGNPRSGALLSITAPTKYFGDYELIEQIARGGMGVVWKARQISLKRLVALKLLIEGQFASELALKRFELEGEAAAQLDHPNIVPIYEVAYHEGWPYIAMKLIDGPSLEQCKTDFSLSTNLRCGDPQLTKVGPGCPQPARVSTDEPQPNQAALAPSLPNGKLAPASTSSPRERQQRIAMLLSKVARTVHFAHQRGILHRDLKPGNILIDKDGEPHVTDFGLAKLASASGSLTLTGSLLGSPHYMAPEQAVGNNALTSTASDIYSLGVILFEFLTGRLPFEAETPLATLKLVMETEPLRPRSINPAIDRDLETICLKCLAKNPCNRYETAAVFANDLDSWIANEPIIARQVGRLERSFKWVRRHPLKATLAVVIAAAVVGPLISTFYLYHFVIPLHARTHPIIGWEPTLNGYALTLETSPKATDRATLNFDKVFLMFRPRPVVLYFTNLPPETLAWATNLSCRVMADIPAAPDEARSPIVRHGQAFSISRARWQDRAYYIAPIGGWTGRELAQRAPNARICIIFREDTSLFYKD
jgi:serine/threonine protein kinase